MTTEDLLKPRYLAIANDTSEDFEEGQIFIQDDNLWFKLGSEVVFCTDGYFEKYPHLFRLMGWWEERQEGDMPSYLKFNDERNTTTSIGDDVEPEFHKVKRHWATSLDPHWRYRSKQHFISEWHCTSYCYGAFEPVTQQEYVTYINQTKKPTVK